MGDNLAQTIFLAKLIFGFRFGFRAKLLTQALSGAITLNVLFLGNAEKI
jgi:hypothetical protein